MIGKFPIILFYKMSRPEIVIQKKYRYGRKPNYVKRTQKDYSLTLKIQIVKEVESGALSTLSAQRKYGIQSRSTVVTWLRKYGNFDWENQTPSNMPKSPEQRILELEAKVKLLENKSTA